MMPQTDNGYSRQEIIQTVEEVAQLQNLQFEQAIILSDRSNIIIHLYPQPIVARVAAITATVREGDAWLQREIAVSNYLIQHHAPVIASSPLLQPGVYHQNGLVMSFWEYVEELSEPFDPIIAGKALQICHETLTNFVGELPYLDAIRESEEIFIRLQNQGVFAAVQAQKLEKICDRIKTYFQQSSLPMQPVHGDANSSNVINTTKGVLWIDWEDTFLAPIYWDIACFVATSRVFETDIEPAEAFLQGYEINHRGKINADILDVCIEARTFQTMLWNYIIGQEHPSSLERFQKRLQWLGNR